MDDLANNLRENDDYISEDLLTRPELSEASLQ